MDQLKNILVVMRKYHFWILCVLAIAIGMAPWWLATGDLIDQIDARKSKIEGAFSQMRGIVERDNHPNEPALQALDTVQKETAEKVRDAWTTLYNQQKKDNKLPANLSQDFRNDFEALTTPESTLRRPSRQEYMNFIGDHIPTLFAEINIRRSKEVDASATGGANGNATRGGTEAEMGGVVDWDQEQRKALIKRFTFRVQPTTEQVVLAQEDLWVYEALIRVIKNTNGGATRHDSAPIRKIENLLIGEKVTRIGLNPEGFGGMLGEEGVAGGDGENFSRYVDEKGLPLPGPDYKHPRPQFRMMPIRLEVEIRQDQIPKLLAECANSTMPIEVRRVGLGPGEMTKIDFAQVDGGAGRQGGMADGSDEVVSHDYIPVEIEGIICIYNPPDAEALGVSADADAEQPESTTEAGETS